MPDVGMSSPVSADNLCHEKFVFRVVVVVVVVIVVIVMIHCCCQVQIYRLVSLAMESQDIHVNCCHLSPLLNSCDHVGANTHGLL